MRRFLVALVLATVLVACQSTAPVTPDPDPDPDPDPGPLTVSVRDYYATDGTRTLVLVDVVANRPATLSVRADCFLTKGVGMSLIGYEGTIQVETMGSNRALYYSNRGVPSPGASTISCSSIVGTSGSETVDIRVR